MQCGVALWCLMEPGQSVARRIETFAEAGFDAVSLLPHQLLDDPAAARDAVAALDATGLVATVHGSSALAPDGARRILDLLGDRLRRRLHGGDLPGPARRRAPAEGVGPAIETLALWRRLWDETA